jgi:uncharacterized protein YndB with AHSA1/START domain
MTTVGTLTIEPRGDREIVMTHTFDAPRHLVFAALTQPALLKRWLGVFGGWSMAECEVDLRVGGGYRYVWHGPDDARMAMRGEYREIVPNERIVSTEAFEEPWYPGEALGTATLAEQDGKTTLTTVVRYASREARDGVIAAGMARGVAAGYEALDAVLATMPARDADGGHA